jgi:prepilin-type N-terminal cleavage/methylation domain-containing protein
MVKRNALTLVELVMVIVVMGVIASIGADIISNLYTNYLQTRTVNRLQTQTEITLEQIAKRLQYRIKPTVIARDGVGNIVSLDNAGANDPILEWIGYSNEAFRGNGQTPGWSGLIDLEHPQTSSATSKLVTPGSDLATANTIIQALSYGDIDLAGAANPPALIFKQPMNFDDIWFPVPVDSNFSIIVNSTADGNFSIIDPPGVDGTNRQNLPIHEHYYLAHTAYAIVPGANTNPVNIPADFNLTLHYNYQPWLGQNYNNDGQPAVLAEHVSLFRFRRDGDVIRLKLCLHDNNETGIGNFIVTCKERIVY